MNSNGSTPASAQQTAEGGYGSPTPEQEMPGGRAPADDSAPAQDNGAPDDPQSAETPVEAPSTEAPIEKGNAESTASDRESFSSESDADASGEEI